MRNIINTMSLVKRQQRNHLIGNQHRKRPALLSNELRKALLRKGPDNQRAIQRIVQAMVAKAESGDMVAIKEIYDRMEGKVKEGDRQPIRVIVSRDLAALEPAGLEPLESSAQDDVQDADLVDPLLYPSPSTESAS
jgi:hypothetical protein